MKFNVEIEIEDLEEDEYFDDKFKKELREAIISQYVKNMSFEEHKYYNNLRTDIIKEAKEYIHQRVDRELENVVNMIARKKAILEMTPEALNLSSEIDKALARKFGNK